MIHLANRLRSWLACRLIDSGLTKGIFLARLIGPSTTSLVRHSRRVERPLPLPTFSHLIYHQQTVEQECLANSLRSLSRQIPSDHEVVILDVGATAPPQVGIEEFHGHEWFSMVRVKAALAEQRSYTFGLNAAVPSLRAPRFVVWRSDYVYPPDLCGRYLAALEQAEFASPYEVLVGSPSVDARFVALNEGRLDPFDEEFWRRHGSSLSLYETQDPALFATTKCVWSRIGGLHHDLWGYGWQFAEFAARVRVLLREDAICYFGGSPAVHQTHGGSMMHKPSDQVGEAAVGASRFASFLGGQDCYRMYRLNQRLAACPPINVKPTRGARWEL